ncbi:MAG: ABC-type polysaccharide transport system, permease component [Lacrimispora sp.]|jgi:putative aldouronate transport system permease protein|nr:ABC-type polysaccharide transport system, permease component [Lacrimispora sp.]
MNKKMKGPAAYAAGENKRPLLVSLRYYRGFYLMFLPVLIFALVFHYIPMLGIRYAFYSYKGIKEPVFIGLAHFEKMLNMPGFWSAFGNTITLSIVKLLLNTIMAVVLSLMLNELRSVTFKKIAQTIVYLPHFMSWVVTASVFALILSPTSAGLLNAVLSKFGIVNEGIYFLGSQSWWRPMFYVINVWKDTGWGTIIFIATLSGINPELYEAASMDGAGRFNRLRFITMPALNNTIITVLILNLAKVMNLFESVFVLQNDAVSRQADVLQTYIYTQTFNSGALPDYGYSTAVGLVSSLVGCFLVLVCNKASYKVRGRGIV